MTRIECGTCHLEIIELQHRNHFDHNDPQDRDLLRYTGWYFRRTNHRWRPTCPTCWKATRS